MTDYEEFDALLASMLPTDEENAAADADHAPVLMSDQEWPGLSALALCDICSRQVMVGGKRHGRNADIAASYE